MLELGSTPVLSLVDTHGQDLALRLQSGGRGTFIYFMRALSCAQCNAAVARMVRERLTFDAAGIRVLIAVPEERAAAARWQEHKNIPFEVVVGISGTAHAEVGLLRKVFGLVQQSGSILLDQDGVVRHSHVSTNPGASYDGAEVAQAISALAPSTTRPEANR